MAEQRDKPLQNKNPLNTNGNVPPILAKKAQFLYNWTPFELTHFLYLKIQIGRILAGSLFLDPKTTLNIKAANAGKTST